MKVSILRHALTASALCLFLGEAVAQTATAAAPGAITTLECYSDAGPLQKNATSTFQTSGECQKTCAINAQYPVMAIVGGSTCYCGSELPPLDAEVDISKCNSPCSGFDTQMCGGIGYFQVYLTGISGDVQHAPNATSSSSSSSSTHSTASSVPTVVITASSTPTASPEPEDKGPNKVGIAVGVVVGVVAIAAIIGGALFYMKQKRRREIEEEHKAQAAVNSFVGSGASDSKSDARLDPSMASSYRRESIGSIADERDFSRRILQVRNPDRGSVNSVA